MSATPRWIPQLRRLLLLGATLSSVLMSASKFFVRWVYGFPVVASGVLGFQSSHLHVSFTCMCATLCVCVYHTGVVPWIRWLFAQSLRRRTSQATPVTNLVDFGVLGAPRSARLLTESWLPSEFGVVSISGAFLHRVIGASAEIASVFLDLPRFVYPASRIPV